MSKYFLRPQYKCKSTKEMETYTLRGCQAGHWALVLITVITSSPWERKTERNRQKKKKAFEFLLHPIYRTTSALRQNSKDFVFYFLQFVYLSTTTKRKVSFQCFISFPKPLKILYSWQYFTSGCVFKISAIVWSIDPFVVVVMWYLDPREKDTSLYNNTLLRTKRNSYNKTTLVKNSQRHVQRR